MSRFEYWEWYEQFWFIVGIIASIVVSIGVLAGIAYAIWGPHFPPPPVNPRTEFITSCEGKGGVPNTLAVPYTCQGVFN